MQDTSSTLQLAAASLLGRLQAQALHGPRVTLTLQRLLPPGLVAAIQASLLFTPHLVCYSTAAVLTPLPLWRSAQMCHSLRQTTLVLHGWEVVSHGHSVSHAECVMMTGSWLMAQQVCE